MTVELSPQQQHMVTLAIESGAYHDADEVISSALAMLAEDIENGVLSQESRLADQQRTGKELVDAGAKIRGLLTDEEVDTLFTRSPSFGRLVDFE